jgi:hypothetical protein
MLRRIIRLATPSDIFCLCISTLTGSAFCHQGLSSPGAVCHITFTLLFAQLLGTETPFLGVSAAMVCRTTLNMSQQTGKSFSINASAD